MADPPRWLVSTLVPGLHGRPRFVPHAALADALEYARGRAKAGPRREKDGGGGKIYYVLWDGSETPTYRVFRGMLGLAKRAGFEHDGRRREFLIVQQHAGELPNNKIRWAYVGSQSVELLDPERERDLKRS